MMSTANTSSLRGVRSPSGYGKPMVDSKVRPQSDLARLLVELLLYFSIITRSFAGPLGLLSVQGLSGAIVVLCATGSLLLMLSRREGVPMSIWFALGMNVAANCSQVISVGQPPIIGDFLRPMLFWGCYLLMACYVVRDDKAARRFALVLGFMVFVSVVIGGGYQRTGTASMRIERLELEGGVGSMFANSNDLAYLAAVVAAALLFYSHRAGAVTKPIYWFLALVMIYVTLSTISRGAAMALACALLLFIMGSSVGTGGKITFLLVVVLAGAGYFMYQRQLEDIRNAYEFRAEVHSSRLDAWVDVPEDVIDTLLFGRGPARAYTSNTHINPHNTFLWVHLAFGGVCAWLYVTWVSVIMIRGMRMLLSKECSFRVKSEAIALFGVALCSQMMTNFGPANFGVVFVMALMDHYTAPYSQSAIRTRQASAGHAGLSAPRRPALAG